MLLRCVKMKDVPQEVGLDADYYQIPVNQHHHVLASFFQLGHGQTRRCQIVVLVNMIYKLPDVILSHFDLVGIEVLKLTFGNLNSSCALNSKIFPRLTAADANR